MEEVVENKETKRKRRGEVREIITRFAECGKRIIFILNEKGGVGKTFTARLMMSYLSAHPAGLKVLGIDLDERKNADGFRAVFPNQVEWINCFEEESKDEILGFFDVADVLIVDSRASMQSQTILSWITETDLPEHARAMGGGVTFCYPINDALFPIENLHDGLTKYGEEVDFLVVRNEGMTQNWRIWMEGEIDGVHVRDLALSLGAGEMTLPSFEKRKNIIKAWSELGKPLGDLTRVDHLGKPIHPGLFSAVQLYLAQVEYAFEPVQDKLLPANKLGEGQWHPWYNGISKSRLIAKKIDREFPISWKGGK